MKQLLQLALLLSLVGTTACEEKSPEAMAEATSADIPAMSIDTTTQLTVYYPQFKTIDLVCGDMPAMTDSRVTMCLAAAFTGKRSDTFSHDNIAGNHVSGGEFHKGYDCTANTGTFVYYDKHWQFLPTTHSDSITRAADAEGMAFSQIMLVYNGHVLSCDVGGRNRFRALCEADGQLCIAESRHLQDIGAFQKSLADYGMHHALYLQPGQGWNYSWYRDADGLTHVMHPKTHDYATNWLTFYLPPQQP